MLGSALIGETGQFAVLYRTLSEKGNPELKTLSAILKAMGMRLAIQPLNHHGQHHACA